MGQLQAPKRFANTSYFELIRLLSLGDIDHAHPYLLSEARGDLNRSSSPGIIALQHDRNMSELLEEFGFLMTPVPEPSAVLTLMLGALVLGMAGRWLQRSKSVGSKGDDRHSEEERLRLIDQAGAETGGVLNGREVQVLLGRALIEGVGRQRYYAMRLVPGVCMRAINAALLDARRFPKYEDGRTSVRVGRTCIHNRQHCIAHHPGGVE